MRHLNNLFMEKLIEAVSEKFNVDDIVEKVAEGIDTTEIFDKVVDSVGVNEDDVMDEAVERVTGDIKIRRIEESIIDSLVDDIDKDDITDRVAHQASRDLDTDAIMEAIVERVANRIFEELTEPVIPEIGEVEPPANLPHVYPATDDEAERGYTCSLCGGSMFLHRSDERCPSEEISA